MNYRIDLRSLPDVSERFWMPRPRVWMNPMPKPVRAVWNDDGPQPKRQSRAASPLESVQERRRQARHLERVRELERARLAREIHDELGNALTALKLDLAHLSRSHTDPNGDVSTEPMLAAVDTMIGTVQRIVSDLRPRILDDVGLLAALEWQIHQFEKRTGVRCTFHCRGASEAVDVDRSTAVFRIFQEILTNIARHSQATAVRATLTIGRTSLRLQVRDNGVGIRVPSASDRRLGLIGMQERASAFGGDVIVMGAPKKGTRVRVRIPLRRRRHQKGPRA
jgi:signal transduction histidine kinase